MSIREITTEELCKMSNNNEEGLILRGCGGDLTEWVDGINNMLTDECILLNGSNFLIENCATFNDDEITCLLFPFKGVKLDIGKLSMWRLVTRDTFGGIWLSDYVANYLEEC